MPYTHHFLSDTVALVQDAPLPPAPAVQPAPEVEVAVGVPAVVLRAPLHVSALANVARLACRAALLELDDATFVATADSDHEEICRSAGADIARAYRRLLGVDVALATVCVHDIEHHLDDVHLANRAKGKGKGTSIRS